MKKSSFFSLNLPDKIFGIEKSFLILFLPPLVLIILFLIVFNLIFLPKISQIGEIKASTEKVKLNTSKIREQSNYLMSIDEEELKRNAEYLDNAVLRDKKSYILVEIIRGVANKFNYQLESFSLSPGELKEDDSNSNLSDSEIVRMPIKLSMIGPGENDLDLVLALEKALPILFIDKFEIKSVGELSILTLSISSYYISDKMEMETDNLTLSDLILSKDEAELIKRISTFDKIEVTQLEIEDDSEFKIYERPNPFSL